MVDSLAAPPFSLPSGPWLFESFPGATLRQAKGGEGKQSEMLQLDRRNRGGT